MFVCVCLRVAWGWGSVQSDSPGSHTLTLITYRSSNIPVSRLQPRSLNNHEDPENMKSHPNRACNGHNECFPSPIDSICLSVCVNKSCSCMWATIANVESFLSFCPAPVNYGLCFSYSLFLGEESYPVVAGRRHKCTGFVHIKANHM